jgi:hypothetical protein
MNLLLLNETRLALRRRLQELDAVKPACSNCIYLLEQQCSKFQATPPDEWKRGPVECTDWVYDEVPF